jgi:hypothetical protein
MREANPIFDEAALLRAGCDAYERMHEMAVVYEQGSATDFNERQFVFELGNKLRDQLRRRDPETKHPFVAYEYHYPKDSRHFRKTECDIVLWERRGRPKRENSQWIEIKSTGFKYGSWRNNFGGLNKAREEDYAKLAQLDTECWMAGSTASWVWLYQTTNYAVQFKKLWSKKGWSKGMSVAQVSKALGKPNTRNVNLPKILLAATNARTAQSATICVRTDLETAPEGKAKRRKPLLVFIVVCSVRKLRK